jgi:hypothetical protein
MLRRTIRVISLEGLICGNVSDTAPTGIVGYALCWVSITPARFNCFSPENVQAFSSPRESPRVVRNVLPSWRWWVSRREVPASRSNRSNAPNVSTPSPSALLSMPSSLPRTVFSQGLFFVATTSAPHSSGMISQRLLWAA